jgi:hypothetical protein
MPYASGESPELGAYVKNKWEQPGTVTTVHTAQDGEQRVCIRWDDGGKDLLFATADQFTPVSRNRS